MVKKRNTSISKKEEEEEDDPEILARIRELEKGKKGFS